MARRKLNKRHIRNIQKGKVSYFVSIPIDIVRKLGWRERQKVVVRAFGKSKIVIKDWLAPQAKRGAKKEKPPAADCRRWNFETLCTIDDSVSASTCFPAPGSFVRGL